MSLRRPSSAFAVLLGLGIAPSAHADWVFGGVDGGNATTSVGGSPSLDISGVAAANGGSFTNSTTYTINGYASGAAWTSQTLMYHSGGGLGMNSDGQVAPNQAIDNGPATNSSGTVTGLGNTEAVLLSFSSSVVLASIGLGYVSGDADISLFRYVGGTTAPTLVGTSASAMSGWELVGNYGDLVFDTTSPYNTVNSGGLGSSWWLISAYNTAYGTTSKNGGSLSQGNDYFEIYAVDGTACTSSTAGVCSPGSSVPEPGSLALVGTALLGVYGTRRRR